MSRVAILQDTPSSYDSFCNAAQDCSDGKNRDSESSSGSQVNATKYADLDILFTKTGGFGIYQCLLVFYTQWLAVLYCTNTTVLYSLGGIPAEYVCLDAVVPGSNLTEVKEMEKHNACFVRSNCSKFIVTPAFQFYSYAQEFDLVCENEWKKQLIPSLAAGMGIAYVFVQGHLADHYGRKWTVIVCNSMTLLAILIASFSTGWKMLASVMTLTIGAESMIFNDFAEMVTKEYRIILVVSTQWCLTYPIVSLIAYLSGDWRIYLRVIFSICIPMQLLHLLTLLESPRFLMQRANFRNASKGLKTIAKINRVKPQPSEIEEDYLKTLGFAKPCRVIPFNFVDLFSGKAITIRTLLQSLNRLTYNIANIVIVLNLQSLSGSPFLNIALLGILKLWVPGFVVWLDWKAPNLKRRYLVMLSLGLVAVCYIINASIEICKQSKTLKTVLTVSSQTAVLTLTSIYTLMIKSYNVELFPTYVRNVANGFSSAIYGIGGILGPQILLTQLYWIPLPSVIVLVLLILTLVANFLFLPESKDKPLIESINQMKEITTLIQVKFDFKMLTERMKIRSR